MGRSLRIDDCGMKLWIEGCGKKFAGRSLWEEVCG